MSSDFSFAGRESPMAAHRANDTYFAGFHYTPLRPPSQLTPSS
ncbi:hypothetical protein AB7M26_004079 [Pseudomonas sp. F-14 TE3482]